MSVIPDTFPSSIFPAISGIRNYPSGYVTVADKQLLLANGSGLFTGNMFDFGQERDFNQAAPWITGPDGENILGTQLAGFTGKGINRKYVSPESYQAGNDANGDLYGPSGIFVTYPPSGTPSFTTYTGSKGSGIFNFKKFLSDFSNAKASKDATGAAGIDNFSIFNDYIHYLPFSSAGGGAGVGTDQPPGEGLADWRLFESSTGGGAGAGTAPQPGGGLSAASVDDAIRIPFVADLIPTTSTWDRYGTGEIDDEADQEETDPDYGNGT